MIESRKLRSLGIPLSLALLLGGCTSTQDRKPFDDMPGDIIAGTPATVVKKLYIERRTGKNGPYGWAFYLNTEDCWPGNTPLPGPQTGAWCSTRQSNVSLETYLAYKDGDTIRWQGSPNDSLVEGHAYDWVYKRRLVNDLGLLVQQCIDASPEKKCIEDTVVMGPQTWLDAHEGQTIIFSGEPGTVVS